MNSFYTQPSAFEPDFVPDANLSDRVAETKVLVIGAGGLGCEILKNLVLSGFEQIHVIDMDTIDVTNLNRQSLFRDADVGKPKAQVAAEFVNTRVSKNVITAHYNRIQDKDEEFYRQFEIVVCGLDSLDARRWVSAMFVNMVDESDPSSLKPIIDGGTEGFKGQVRVILPTLNACHECASSMHSKKVTYPICTIANTPRLPEHCIEWASVVQWPKVHEGLKLDADNIEHMQWVYSTALKRADEHGISGITLSLAQGVVKNIIPAIASTNAIISGCHPYLNNYMLYVGDSSVYSHTFELEKKEDCLVCGNAKVTIEVSKTITLEELIEEIKINNSLQLKKPSLRTDKNLYMQAPPFLEVKSRPNLKKQLYELFESNSTLTVTDPSLMTSVSLTVTFTD
ncbi:hypothetical protein BB558_004090 [Smittium angustum]|uniref:NEDD8-activating enzyme E1 catalytic subunit n=1 Tax=Smittium angustum TaxID=133377 RepID=A0A2U1J452_SMIAN|nr:hypothetical protein BB558_004090 [Smittium angustum]